MGKRELVLIAAFVMLGIGVYQVTAPPPPPGSEGFSFSGIFRNMKRGVQGSRESAWAEAKQTVPVDAAIKEIRINVSRTSDITVTGEDREDVAAEYRALGRGFDQAEATATANATKLKTERIGDAVVVSLDNSAARSLPRNNAGIGEITIVLKVPRRLALRMEPHSGRVVVSKVASADIMGSRGETRVTGLAGRLTLTHSGGPLEIDDAPSLKLNSRNSRGTVKHVTGPMMVDAIGAELTMTDLTGPLEIEARNTELRIESIKGLKGPLRINSTGGELRIEGLRTEARLDGRNTNIDVMLDQAAPVTIYNLGEIRVTAPPGGYALDAGVTEGHITLEDGEIKPSEGNDPRATGPVRGGGPTLTLRATRGTITVRKPGGK